MKELRFEWHKEKAEINRRKHGVTFQEAATVFDDDRRLRIYDLEHSTPDEDREIVIGFSHRKRLLMVVIYEQSENVVRIISARRATKAEGTRYFVED